MQRAHANRAGWGRRKFLFAQFGAAGRNVPECLRDVISIASHAI
jgi:hypothetical protein